MGDSTPYVGTGGTIATFGLGSVNELVGICVGITTLIYLFCKLQRLLKEDNGKDSKED